jgi:hypothetical protein
MKIRWATAAVLMGGLAAMSAGCATSEEWSDWRSHTSHFASGTHATFSLRNNKDGSNPRVKRSDVEAAGQESWWGQAITVNPDQIFQS